MLMQNENRIIRILESQEDHVLIVNCTQKSMPMWISKTELSDFSACEDDSLPCSLPDFESLSPDQKRCAHERYTLIAGVLPFIGDERLRCDAISRVFSSRGISKQTIRNYLYRYLVYISNDNIFRNKLLPEIDSPVQNTYLNSSSPTRHEGKEK